MGRFTVLRNGEISEALEGARRQYFVGDLNRPQTLGYERDTRVELGLTAYAKATGEPPHRHSTATEWQYVLSGHTQYLDLDTDEIHDFVAGDVYAIYPGTCYAQRSKSGTRILFVKVPSLDDKEVVAPTSEVSKWLTEPVRTVRTDFSHDPAAPAPNSLVPAAAVAILDDLGRLLLTRRADSGKWTMPGGTQEFGESLPACAVREVREECALEVEVTEIIGTFTDPDVRVAYSDGEVRQEFTVLFAGRAPGGTVEIDHESTEFRWVPLTEATSLQLADSQRRRIEAVREFLDRGARHLG